MKKTGILLIAFILVGVGVWYASREAPSETNEPTSTGPDSSATSAPAEVPAREMVTVVATDLEIPWDIAFLPDGTMLVTERPGRLVHIEENRSIEVDGVEHTGEGGLLGIALHPNFEQNRYLYLYQTTRVGSGLENRVNRYVYRDNELVFDRVIVDGIAGAPYHDGGRIEFGPNGYLWIATGDATSEADAQSSQTFAGGILRVTADGSTPEGNPFGNEVWSYGHRNPQGLAWDADGRLWSSEHGRSGLRSGMDEINLIEPGANYGWPVIEGDEMQEGMTSPVAHSGPDVTWAPASATYWDGSIFFGGLKGEAVYEAVLDEDEVADIRRYFFGEFGRIRTTRIGPDGMMYITTSNRDGRGEAGQGDDRIIRIDPEQVFR
ncbi:MAG: PQQ-dependent sugar dehydrogenase [Candidatus Paceibacterota bacterium]